MTHLKDLRGVSPDDAAKLKEKGIETLDDLWRCVGADFDEGIDKVETETKVTHGLLYPLLIAASFGEIQHPVEGEPFSPSSFVKRLWVRAGRFWRSRGRRWAEALLALVTLLLAALAIRSGYVSHEMAKQVVLTRARSLAPFQRIGAENVELKVAAKEQKSFADLKDVVGRYALRPLAPGTTLREEHLLTAKLSEAMTNRKIISIPVNPQTLNLRLNPPVRVSLLVSPRAPSEKSPQPLVLSDVILLAVNQQADKSFIEAALTENDINNVKFLMGAAEVFLLQPIE